MSGGLSEHVSGGNCGNARHSWHLLCANGYQTECHAEQYVDLFSEGDSSYNALQVDLNHRFSHGLVLRGVYTWSRAIDDGDSLNATTSGGEPALTSDPYDLGADPGIGELRCETCGGDQCQLSVAIPEAAEVTGGWTINSIVTLQAGFPFTPQLSYNPSNNGDTRNPVRPFVNPAFTGKVIEGSVNQWFNPAAFLAPAASSGFYGNLGRDTLIGPGLGTWDVSLLKNTPIGERAHVQFRAEVFNVLNRANFNTPNAVVFTPSAYRHGRANHEYFDNISADSARVEVALVVSATCPRL